MHVWVCNTVTCTIGEPLVQGVVVLIDGFCFGVTNNLSANPSGTRIASTAPLLCVDDCHMPPCPTGELYWPGRTCSGQPTNVWVCGVTPGCHVRGCVIVDSNSQPRTFDQIPQQPTPTLIRFSDLGPESMNCCDCQTFPGGPVGAGPCVSNPLLGFNVPVDCVFQQQRQCCCEVGPDGFTPTTHYRVTRCRTTQHYVRPSTGSDFTLTLDLIDPCQGTTHFYSQGTGYSGPTEDYGTAFPFFEGCGPACGGNWQFRAPRIRGLGATQYIIGDEGIGWGYDCHDITDRAPFEVVTVSQWSNYYDCRTMRQFAEYVYVDQTNGLTITTRFEFVLEIYGQNNCEANCTGIINSGFPIFAEETGGDVGQGGFVRLLP